VFSDYSEFTAIHLLKILLSPYYAGADCPEEQSAPQALSG
jgi:hypothetical protein